MTAVDGMFDKVVKLVANYDRAAKKLLDYKASELPPNTVVYVECDQYTGYGISVLNDGVKPNQIAVKLENGNTWWYPVEKTFPANTRPGDWPEWIKKISRKRIAALKKEGVVK